MTRLRVSSERLLQVAAVIHEWSYDAMCHDLLELEGNKYSYEVWKICFSELLCVSCETDEWIKAASGDMLWFAFVSAVRVGEW